MGIQTNEAADGQIAVNMVTESKTEFDLIFMDICMPIMDGYQATSIIRQKGYKIPIIALTASLPNEIANEVKGLGIDGMVLKPFVPDDLYQTVLQFTMVEQ